MSSDPDEEPPFDDEDEDEEERERRALVLLMAHGPMDEAERLAQEPPVDRSGWGEGSWEGEPDRAEWEHEGLPCLALRHPMFGFWCGYAAVPPGHPLHGVGYQEASERANLQAHHGINYSAPCDGGRICHVPKPGEPDDVWWFGFDCGHAFDLAPAMEARMKIYEEKLPPEHPLKRLAVDMSDAMELRPWTPVYRSLAYVQAETMDLARQLARVGGTS